MTRVDLRKIRLRPGLGSARFLGHSGRALLGIFLACVAFCGVRLWLPQLLPGADEGLYLLGLGSGLMATLALLATRLPVQNVLVVAWLIGGLALVPQLPGTEALGRRLPGAAWGRVFVWVVPAVWVILLLSCRGLALVMLRPWRETNRNYGLWVLGLTVVLSALGQVAFELFAVKVGRWWSWDFARAGSEWHGIPAVAIPIFILAALVMAAVAIPWLIDKYPHPPPPAMGPVWIWLALNALFLAGGIAVGCWPLVALAAGQMLSAGAGLGLSTAARNRRPRRFQPV